MNINAICFGLYLCAVFGGGCYQEESSPGSVNLPRPFAVVDINEELLKDDRTTYSNYVKEYISVDERSVALVRVNVIDGTGGPASFNQTVLIEAGVIAEIGSADSVKVPSDARIIDLEGRTLIPGIVGTHNHLHMPGIPMMEFTAPRMYLASGVTTIQTTGSAAPYLERNLARSISRGDSPGPDIVQTGPYFNGAEGSLAMVHPRDEAHIEEVIRYWVGEGVQWFKVYRHIEPSDLESIITIAHNYGAKVTGHLCSVTYAEASEMGIDAIEHGFIHSYDLSADKEEGICPRGRGFRNTVEINSGKVRRLQEGLISGGVALSSTLAIFEAQVPNRAVADQRTLEAMAPRIMQQYQERKRRMEASAGSWYFKESWLLKSMAFDYAFYKRGGLLTAGLDPGLHNFPGFGDQRNFELFIEAGFEASEAIQVMSANGAQLLGLNNIGTIEEGKRADIVVLGGDLIVDPSMIRKVELVFKEGYGFDPDKLLADVKGQVGYR